MGKLVLAEDNIIEDTSLGTIAIDSIFTPIKNVSYSIEDYRVGQKTDFEKLNINTFYFRNDIPYCRVKENLFEARFSRPALYQISKSMKIVDGNYFLNDTLINHI